MHAACKNGVIFNGRIRLPEGTSTSISSLLYASERFVQASIFIINYCYLRSYGISMKQIGTIWLDIINTFSMVEMGSFWGGSKILVVL